MKKKHLKYHINLFVNLDSSAFIAVNKEDYKTSDGKLSKRKVGFLLLLGEIRCYLGNCFLSRI